MAYRLRFVAADVVDDDDVAGTQSRHQHLPDIGEEALAVDRPVDDAGRSNDAIVAQRRQKVSVLSGRAGTLATSRSPRGARP